MKCLYCEKELTGLQKKFCSLSCKTMIYNKDNPDILKKANKKYNDKKKLLKHTENKNVIRICLYCKKKFTTDNIKKECCNTICSSKYHNIKKMMTYRDSTIHTRKIITKKFKKEQPQNYLSLQRLANVYNNLSSNEDDFCQTWQPIDQAYYIDQNRNIELATTFNPDTIYFKTIEIAKVCCNFFYRTHYNINRSNRSYMKNKKGDMVLI